MPINLYHPLWKEILKYLGWILLFVFLWFRGCSGTTPATQTAKVIVSEVKGKFQAKKPVHEVFEMAKESPEKALKNNINKPSTTDFDHIEMAKENEKLKTDFAKETDSLKKVIAYNKAIQLNKFSSNFEDENIIINIEGIVQGEVKEITPSYIRKKIEMEVFVKQKETVLRVLVGGGFGLNKELNQAAYKLDLNFQNRKGDIISGEFLQVGTQSFGMVGFKKSIINIKR
jgi:hypothetical protein